MGHIGAQRIILEEIDSTNVYAGQLLPQYPPHGLIVQAQRQTAGKGTGGASWHASPLLNLTFSVLLYPKGLSADCVYLLNAWCSLAVADVVADYAPQVTVKWPNDVYVGDRKIAGVLIQTQIQGTSVQNCVAGIGLNVNETAFPLDLLNTATSLKLLTGRDWPLNSVLEKLLERMNKYFDQLETEPNQLARRYAERLYRLGHTAMYADAEGTFWGKICGVAADGRLILDKSGEVCYYAAKELAYL